MKNMTGLSKEEVEKRYRENKVNYDTTTPSKSIKQILIENIFTLFNFIKYSLSLSFLLIKFIPTLYFVLGIISFIIFFSSSF